MQKEKLSLSTLSQLDDGTVGAVVDAAIAEALADCDDRPYLEKARKITIEVAVSPVLDNGRLKGVDVATGVKLAKPPQAARDQYLRTNYDTSTKTVEAFLADAYQDGLDFGDERERN